METRVDQVLHPYPAQFQRKRVRHVKWHLLFRPQVVDPQKISGALHGLQMAVPRWSPDGKHIAFIGGLMSDQGSTGGDVWMVDAKGGQPVDLTPGIDGTPTYEVWFDDHSLGFVEDRSGHTLFQAWDINKKASNYPQPGYGRIPAFRRVR